MMEKCRINIVIAEASEIVSEGLANLLLKSESHFYISKVSRLDELSLLCIRDHPDIVVINPALLINKTADFSKLKKGFPEIRWVGLLYSLFDSDTISRFDDTIGITDSPAAISKKLSDTSKRCNCGDLPHDDLSERETEVLIQLVNGLSNKEIANKLNISIHTVISHRKNIVEKTGIKSLSGLTIYAISRKITSLRPD
jgi:DNA-binding NarL/FixJ family response regulator